MANMLRWSSLMVPVMMRGAMTSYGMKLSAGLVKRESVKVMSNSVRTYATTKKDAAPVKSKRRGKIPGAVPLETAILILKSLSLAQEFSTVELMLKYDRSKYNKELIGSCVLQRPMAHESKILVLAEGQQAQDALAAGASIVGGPELLEKIIKDEVQFNQLLCTPAMFPHVIKVARYLGPKGLMPSVKKGSVTNDIVPAIKHLEGAFAYKSDPYGWVRVGIAKVNFPTQDIVANVHSLLYSVLEIVTHNTKLDCLDKLLLKSTMGPSLQVSDALPAVLHQYRTDQKKLQDSL